MKVLKATLKQKKALQGTYKNGAVLQFIEDANGNWVVNVNVLTDHSFEAIHADLSNLTEINYVPKIIELL
jgi:hypothetical protein